MTKKVKIIPLEVSSLKSGTSSKNGKTFNWTLYKVVAKVLPKEQKIEATGFDELEAGTETEVELWQEEYNGEMQWKYRTPRRNVWQELDELKERVKKLEEQGVSELQSELKEEVNIDDLGEDEDELGDIEF